MKIRRSLFVNINIFFSLFLFLASFCLSPLSFFLNGIFFYASSLFLRRGNGVCSSRMIVSKWDMLHHGERINQEMTLSTGYLKLRIQLTPLTLYYCFSTSQQKRRQILIRLNLKPNFASKIILSTFLFIINKSWFTFSLVFLTHFPICNIYQTIQVLGI